jgi:hypothetical protein
MGAKKNQEEGGRRKKLKNKRRCSKPPRSPALADKLRLPIGVLPDAVTGTGITGNEVAKLANYRLQARIGATS